jgi:multimeric flavodoxin WrbA
MSKKVLVISASPRKGGNSDVLCDQFIKGAVEAGHKAEKIYVVDKKIGYCIGCGACINKPECSQKDDMAEMLNKLLDCDVLVLATPVYFYCMDAQLKTFIDRTVPKYREMKNKEIYFILTAADPGKNAMDGTLVGLRGFTSLLPDAKEKGTIYGLGMWGMGEAQKSPAMTDAYETGRAV